MSKFQKPRQADIFARRDLTPKKIMEIQRKAANGPLKLPKPGTDERWNLMDTGSAPHVADNKKHYPGATLKDTPSEDAKFSTATSAGFDGK